MSTNRSLVFEGRHPSQIQLEYPKELVDKLKEMVSIKNPCFIYGECGKTVFIKSCFPDVKVYDSREILETKNIGGFYSIRNNTLKYVHGVLVEAMLKGYKICFKNIDANLSLLQYLRPTIKNRKIINTLGNEIVASEDFRIFFTCKDIFDVKNIAFVGPVRFTLESTLGLFRDIPFSFESRKPFKLMVLSIFDFIQKNQNHECSRVEGLECSEICLKEKLNCNCINHETNYLCSKHFRMVCELSDILHLRYESGNAFRVGLYQGVVNVFLKHESKKLSEFLMVAPTSLTLPNMLFAKTAPVESTLNSLILNISRKKPTLLVGETGAGKTALVQYLCSNSEHFFGYKVSLKVVNMSMDFDGSDLIGGYHSIDFDQKIKEMYAKAKREIPRLLNRRSILEDLLLKLTSGSLSNKSSTNNAIANDNTQSLVDEIKLYLSVLDKRVPFYFKEGVLTQAMKNGTWILLDEINLSSDETLNLIEAILSKDEMILYESGDFTPIKIHPSFMIFACMNPHGDFGKKKYDSSIFNKIMFYDFSFSLKCIKLVVQSITRNLVEEVDLISEFYFEFKKRLAKREYANIIEPLVSGRTLCRALRYILRNRNNSTFIYDAFNLLFFTQLDLSSRASALQLFKAYFKKVPENTPFSDVYDLNGYIITPKTRPHLNDIELAIKADLPVLIQGDTSTGKTSIIYALASKHGRRVVRINNHSQTEGSDYIGNYMSSKEGMCFRTGPLITAMKNGHWIILDELNLAPSDVLEVLNRLLDDNQELYVPEIDEYVTPHPNFRLFATQNLNYGGRHGLAKSFRNRFVEIFFYEKDGSEIAEILEKSCKLPRSFIKCIIHVYVALKTERTLNSLITLRDLFRWAKRQPGDYYELYRIGLEIILERQRDEEDRRKVLEVFNSSFSDRMQFEKRVYHDLYCIDLKDICLSSSGNIVNVSSGSFIFTKSYIKLINLIYKAWINSEPVLLIGETGIGKTKICEIVSSMLCINLRSINLHSGTEGSDFIGHPYLEKGKVLWVDGPLVKAMSSGDAFLIDEINLAEDSVLERLNSVLEDKRYLFIPEIDKEVYAHSSFRIVATMNPSGDFGKRELSPALRSRFTEIYFELDPEEYHEIFDKTIEKVCLIADQNKKECGASKYFKDMFRMLKNMSVRKIELICSHIKNIYGNGNNAESMVIEDDTVEKDKVGEMIEVKKFNSADEIWKDCLELIGHITPTNLSESIGVNDKRLFGTHPYYIKKHSGSLENTEYSFNSTTSQLNLKRILRGLTINKGILLEGEPGVGKTSIIQHIAKLLSIPVLRINLSEQTEMSDLLGSYIPVGDSISFVESQMVEFLKKGGWIILDEINLCTQSVIEGLNSILDHRRRIEVNGKVVCVDRSTRVFGTMNPWNKENGRKRLPKSFLDRFIEIKMDNYTKEDIRAILNARYGPLYLFDDRLSLRGNIKANEIKNSDLLNNASTSERSDITYSFEQKLDYFNIRFGSIFFTSASLPSDYAIPHSQIPQVELLLKCFSRNIPVILLGNVGRSSLLNFISLICSLKMVQIDCHKDTDIFDLLGQYKKTESSNESNDNSLLFEWSDSPLVKSLEEPSLTVFNNPEVVDKCVFDRLNSLFESDRTINVYEKVKNTLIKTHPQTRFVLCCDSVYGLSPALVDRCYAIELSDHYSYLDIYKIFAASNIHDAGTKDPLGVAITNTAKNPSNGMKKFKTVASDSLFKELIGTESYINCPSLDIDIKRFMSLKICPGYLNRHLNIYNTLIESEIESMFRLEMEEFTPYDTNLLSIYKEASSYSTRLPTSYSDVIEILAKRPNITSFIKSVVFVYNYNSNITNKPSGSIVVNKICCRDVANTVYDMKVKFIEDLPSRTLSQLGDLLYFAKNISRVSVDTFGADFCYEKLLENFYKLLGDDDPLRLIRSEVANEKIKKQNDIKRKISDTAMCLYKYGRGDIASLIDEFNNTSEEYASSLSKIDELLKRDYKKFKEIVCSITFCEYLNNSELRTFLEGFSDLHDYFLIYLFSRKNGCERCYYAKDEEYYSSKQCSIRLIHKCNNVELPEYNAPLDSGQFERCLKPQYSKYLFYITNNKIAKDADDAKTKLIVEAIAFNELLPHLQSNLANGQSISSCGNMQEEQIKRDDIGESTNSIDKGGAVLDSFTEDEITDCILHLFPAKTIARVIERNSNAIVLGEDAIALLSNIPKDVLPSIQSLSIFSTPEHIISELQHLRIQNEDLANLPFSREYSEFAPALKAVESLESFFTNLYKKESCLILERDYSYFQYLLFDSTIYEPAALERFFLDCRIFEFLDRIFFSESLLRIRFSPILYGYALLYKSFEIENNFGIKHRQTALKLKKEPRLYEESIHGFVDRFLYTPVLKTAKVVFDFPGCNNDHSLLPTSTPPLLDSLLNSCNINIAGNSCKCFKWKLLADSLSKNTSIRNVIMDTLSNAIVDTQPTATDVMNRYLNRKVNDLFNVSEICLSKLICNAVFNLNSQKYDNDTASTVLGLCVYGIEYPFPPYLYFAFKFSNTFEESEELESGTGLHSGHGQSHIENDDVEKEDVNDDCNNEEEQSVDSEGIMMSNEGDLHSVSNENDGESGVDDVENNSTQDNTTVEDNIENNIEEDMCASGEDYREDVEDNVGSTNNSSDESSNETTNDSTGDETTNDGANTGNASSNDNVARDSDVNEFDYQWSESALNKAQTCTSAENYSKRVAGGNLNERDPKDALQEGEGDELVEGEGKTGKACSSIEKSVIFNKRSPDSTRLTNLLRAVLESNKNSKYKGDFKTGKKLNLKKIIPYIASDYRRDRIWMKRAKNDKKEYTLRIFIDNSRSMNDQHLVDVLSEVYYKLEASFSLLNIPTQLYRFGAALRECKIEDFTFDEEATLINWTDQFDDGINIILTDGIFQNVGYSKDNFLVVMIDKGNVKTMSKVSLLENRVFVERYLDSFALKYCIVQNIDDLERVFVEALSNIIRSLFN